jgi:hypothetical protein
MRTSTKLSVTREPLLSGVAIHAATGSLVETMQNTMPD